MKMIKPAYLGVIGGFLAASILAGVYIAFFSPKSAPETFGKILSCDDSGYKGLDPPLYKYTVTLPDNDNGAGYPKGFDLRNPRVTKIITPLNGGTTTPASPDNTTDVTEKTRLDLRFDLKLQRTAQVEIVLQDPTLTFQEHAAVWDPNPGKNDHSKMLCDLKVAADLKSATFIVHAPKKNEKDPKKKLYHVNPNIGLVVSDRDTLSGYSLPIFLDPDLENDGVIDP